ncbi:MAG TPA: cysteine peptidase family C39 domain-containing protein [Polyangia bacterium]|nr:cysteine peptidase family C39 domain-containing protein [Polyangia bacterium]
MFWRSALHVPALALFLVGWSWASPPPSGPGYIARDAPEVRQRSPVDCGPAALQSVLQGFGLEIEYDKLVHLLDVDPREGASIDTVEAVANRLGVEAQQVMIPQDHLFLPGGHRGPMMAIATAQGALKHFLVLWRANADRVQVMDPATGLRRWVDRLELSKRLYVHEMAVPEKAWKEWSRGTDFRGGLFARMRGIGMSESAIERSWTQASADASVRGMQALDAAVRFVAAGPKRRDVSDDVQKIFECSRTVSCSGKDRAPAEFWSAWENGPTDNDDERRVTIRGVVLLNFYGRSQRAQ